MTRTPRTAAVIVFSFALAGCSRQMADVAENPAKVNDGKVNDGALAGIVSIEFPRKAYTFTLAEAARGVRFDYIITVRHDIESVIPRPQDDGFASGPGPSGLFPFEKILGNGQSYSLRDIGLSPEQKKPARTIKQGVYRLSFEWDGRNWTGPSDFDNPKGDPFPPGGYMLSVGMVGEMKTADGKQPYEIANSVEVRLTP